MNNTSETVYKSFFERVTLDFEDFLPNDSEYFIKDLEGLDSDGKFLGDVFLEAYERMEQVSYQEKGSWMNLLKEVVNENKENAAYKLYELFDSKTRLSEEFKATLKLHEIVHVYCFEYEDDYGEAILQLIKEECLIFIVANKHRLTLKETRIDFIVSNEDVQHQGSSTF